MENVYSKLFLKKNFISVIHNKTSKKILVLWLVLISAFSR